MLSIVFTLCLLARIACSTESRCRCGEPSGFWVQDSSEPPRWNSFVHNCAPTGLFSSTSRPTVVFLGDSVDWYLVKIVCAASNSSLVLTECEESKHNAECTTICETPNITLVHKYLLGVASDGPFWLNRTVNALDRVDRVKKFLKAADLRSSLVVMNSLWWDIGRLEAVDPLLLDPLLLTAGNVHEYMRNLKNFVVDTQTQLSIPPLQMVLHTAVHGQVKEGHVSGHQYWKNTHVAQLNNAMRQVAHETGVHVIDLSHQMQGFPAEHTLSDAIHPMPWVLEHLFAVLMLCLHDVSLIARAANFS